jgi:uncharacterized membrane protein YedE/YeeE
MNEFGDEIIGGLLIGLASALPLLFFGRVAGVSGLAASALRPRDQPGREGLVFVVGLILASVAWWALGGKVPSQPPAGNLTLWSGALAGLLVGYGSRLGGGCTSGHGVCGLGRLSKRSLVAVALFMGAAMATTFLMGVLS